jgi:hypothetical protein
MSGIIGGIKGSMKKKGPAGTGIQYTDVLLPYITNKSGTNYLLLLKTNGTIAQTYQMPEALNIASNLMFHRYQNNLYILPRDTSAYYKCDLGSVNPITKINGSYNNGNGQWARVEASKIIRVNSANSVYSVLNLATGAMTDTSYSAGDATGIASHHATLTFYNRTASGPSNFQSTVKWTAAQYGGSPYTGEICSATYSNGTLGGRSTYGDGMNYSRNMSAVSNSTYGFIGRFDGNCYKHTTSPLNGTNFSPGSFTYNSGTYNYVGFSGYTPFCVTSNGNVYQTFISGGSAAIGMYNMGSSTTPSSSVVTPLVYDGTYGCSRNTQIFQINEGNYVAILTQDPANGVGYIKMGIFSDTTLVNSFSINASSYSDTASVMYSNGLSELGTYYAGSTTQ